MIESTLLKALALAGLAVTAAVGQCWAEPPAAAPSIDVRIDSVLATNTNQGYDDRLQLMRPQLSAFNYTTYRLISHDERHADMGRMVDFNLPGGRFLHVEPKGMDGDRIYMEVVLFRGEQPIMTTDLKLRNGALLLLAGPHYEQGTLIVSILAKCNRPVQPSHTPVLRAPVLIEGTPHP